MKMSYKHYRQLCKAISTVDVDSMKEEYKRRDLTPVRWRWDCMWKAMSQGAMSYDTIREYKDSHIDTALRKILDSVW